MSLRVEHTLLHRGLEWDLVEVDGETLFSPEQHGLEPKWITPSNYDASYDAWWCEYRVDTALWLTTLHLGMDEADLDRVSAGEQPPLFGCRPEVVSQPCGPHAVFRLQVPMTLTGAILIGRERARLGGLGPDWYDYQRAEVLTFESGRLVSERDAGPELEACRARFDAFELPPSPPDDTDEATQLAWIRVARAQADLVYSFFPSRAGS